MKPDTQHLPVAYFDKNVIDYMRSPTNYPEPIRSKAYCFKQLVSSVLARDKWVIPYSYGHFQDIQQGKEQFVSGDLNTLTDLTDGLWINDDGDSRSLQLNWMNLARHYEWWSNLNDDWEDGTLTKTRERLHRELKAKVGAPFDSIQVQRLLKAAFSEVEKANTAISQAERLVQEQVHRVSKHISDQSSVLPDKGHRQAVLRLAKSIRIMDGLEVFRANRDLKVANKRTGMIKEPQLKGDWTSLSTQELHSQVDLALRASDYPFADFSEFCAWLHPLQCQIGSPFHREVLLLSQLLDLLSENGEKLKKPTAFQSMMNDSFHLSFGLRSNILISEDQRFLNKAQFIAKWKALPVLILNMDGLIKLILTEWAEALSEQDATSKEFTFKFRDDRGVEIVTYAISLDQREVS